MVAAGTWASALLGIALLMSPARAPADVTARYTAPGGLLTMTVEADDKGDTRLSQGNQYAILTLAGISYVLTSDLSGVYAVSQDDWLAVNLKKLRTARTPLSSPEIMPQFDLVEGPSESVGGRSGTVWSLREHGKPQPTGLEFVVCTDPDLAPVGRAFALQMKISEAGMAAMMGSFPDFSEKTSAIFSKGAVIRMSRMLSLESVKTDPIPATEFALPPVLLTRQQYEARLSGAAH